MATIIFLPIAQAGTVFTVALTLVCAALLIAGVVQYLSMVREGKAGRHSKKRRRSRGRRKGLGLDYFQLDMSRYTGEELVDNPPTKEEVALASWLNSKQGEEPAKTAAVAEKPGDAQLVTNAPWTANVMSHRNMALPPGMTRIMDMLKSNRRYEFSDAGSRHERLGAPCSGGLFAEMQFGRSEDESVLQGSLNPD